MEKTLAKSKFKKYFGQANHYLITALVGLYELEQGKTCSAPQILHTSWHPVDKDRSIERTRVFLFHSFLGSAVDSLDMYVSLLNRKPRYLRDEELVNSFNGCERSVRRKVMLLGRYYDIDKVTLALIDVLITWRNNTLHNLAENAVSQGTSGIIFAEFVTVQERYCGLDATGLAEKAHEGADLTFKETASLIRAVHDYVNVLDKKIIASLDVGVFLREYLLDISKKNFNFKRKYNGFDVESRKRFVKSWIANNLGFVIHDDKQLEDCSIIKL